MYFYAEFETRDMFQKSRYAQNKKTGNAVEFSKNTCLEHLTCEQVNWLNARDRGL